MTEENVNVYEDVEDVIEEPEDNEKKLMVSKAKDKIVKYGKKAAIMAAGIGIGILGFVLGSKSKSSEASDDDDYVEITVEETDNDSAESYSE